MDTFARFALLLALLTLGCGPGGEPSPQASPQSTAGPRLRVLGTVQDGGLPHPGCDCLRCERARSDPARRRWIASVALILPSGELYLIDATPDLPQQLHLLDDLRQAPRGRVDRSPLDGILLTHAHMGHYLGLAFLGFEAVASRRIPVFSSPAMVSFLRANGPWDQLVRMENIVLEAIAPDQALVLGDAVTVTAFSVPHRHEYTDTLGFLLRGPRRTIFYVPDTDGWDLWQPPLPHRLTEVDVALLDGTFYSADELPGRNVSEIGHPLMTTTMDLLAKQVQAGRLEVYFTHLNHSNPALEPDSDARRRLEERGFHVLGEGQEFGL